MLARNAVIFTERKRLTEPRLQFHLLEFDKNAADFYFIDTLARDAAAPTPLMLRSFALRGLTQFMVNLPLTCELVRSDNSAESRSRSLRSMLWGFL
jgi:hypothetical protein